MYDLATTKRNTPMRHTNKPVTPRELEDFIAGTTEEHNEVVMDAYPDFIVCYDSISGFIPDYRDGYSCGSY